MTPDRKSLIRLITSVLAGAVLAALVAFLPVRAPESPLGKPFGGSFAGLVAGDGHTVSDSDFAGRAQLVFFGFTRCPSICPTELQKLAVVLKALTPAEKAKITPLFVSVDPERDTPEAVRDYAAMFDPAIVGLTGTPADVDRIRKDWKVYAAKVNVEGMPDYTVDHSAFLYFRAANGRLLGLFDTKTGPQPIVDAIRKAGL